MGQNARHQSDCRIFETLISQKLFEIKCSFFVCSQISMEALVKSCNIVGFGQACPGMPNFLQNNKVPISLGRVELFCLFVAFSDTSI